MRKEAETLKKHVGKWVVSTTTGHTYMIDTLPLSLPSFIFIYIYIYIQIQMPLRNKLTSIPDQRYPHDDHQWTFLFLIMMPNTVGAIARALSRNEYSLAFLCISVCLCFFLLKSCLSKYLLLPKNDNWRRKFWLKLNMWVLYTAVSFGFVYQFADLFLTQMTVALYSVVSLCSLFLFYAFVIVDIVKFWKIWRYGEDDQYRRLDAGKFKCYSVSIWDKV